MKLFTCVDHAYFWPVGVASVVVARDKDEAIRLLQRALDERGLKRVPFTLQEMDLTIPGAKVLCDGNY